MNHLLMDIGFVAQCLKVGLVLVGAFALWVTTGPSLKKLFSKFHAWAARSYGPLTMIEILILIALLFSVCFLVIRLKWETNEHLNRYLIVEISQKCLSSTTTHAISSY